MAPPRLRPEVLQEAVEAVRRAGSLGGAAKDLGLPKATFEARYNRALKELNIADVRWDQRATSQMARPYDPANAPRCALTATDADPEAVAVIARLAAGGMRDAESILDQLLSSTAGPIEADAVRDLLGLADAELVDGFTLALATGDATPTTLAYTQGPSSALAAGLAVLTQAMGIASAGAMLATGLAVLTFVGTTADLQSTGDALGAGSAQLTQAQPLVGASATLATGSAALTQRQPLAAARAPGLQP
jgi:hypothetical protein